MALALKAPQIPGLGGDKSASAPTAPRLHRVFYPLAGWLLAYGVWLAANYTPQTWQYWVRLVAYVVAAGFGLWCLYRLQEYFRYRLIQHRQAAFQHRQDPLFVAQARLEARVRDVLGRLKAAGLGPYGLPWYVVLGSDRDQCRSLIENSGLDFPQGSSQGLNKSDEQPERWHLANQAVLVELSRAGWEPGRHSQENQLLYGALAKLRPQEPLSGLILTLTAEELAEPDEKKRQQTWATILEQLREAQERMSLNFPVYLVVAGSDLVAGFPQFFHHLGQDERHQMVGWSQPMGPEQEFDQDHLAQGLKELRDTLRQVLLTSLDGYLPPESAGAIFVCRQELDALVDRAAEAARTIFAPNRYLDPLPLRGFYLVGTGAEGAPVVLGAQAAGVALDGHQPQPWFLKELFTQKILQERGLISRPLHALRRGQAMKALGATLLAGVVALAVAQGYDSASEAQRLRRELGPALASAGQALAGGAVVDDPLDLGQRLLAAKRDLAQVGWVRRATGLGRWWEADRMVGQVHRAVYQELFLRDFIQQLQDALRLWDGSGRFSDLTNALAEYILWANPVRQAFDSLTIEPFTDFITTDTQQAGRIIAQFQSFQSEGGPSAPLLETQAQRDIEQVLARMDGYLNPSMPKNTASQAIARESQWWLEFSAGLSELARDYRTLLSLEPPAAGSSQEQAQLAYEQIVDAVSSFLAQIDHLSRLMSQASRSGAGWISAETELRRLDQAAWGWSEVENRVSALRQAARLYTRRIVEPLEKDLYVAQLLAGMPGYGWLYEILSNSLDQEAALVLDPTHQVGPYVRAILDALGEYHTRIEGWGSAYRVWQDNIGDFSDISVPAQVLKGDEREVLNARARVEQLVRELQVLSGQGNQNAAPAGAQATATNQAAAQSTALNKLESLSGLGTLSGTSGKGQKDQAFQELLAAYRWPTLQTSLDGWLAICDRIRLGFSAQYWRELYAKFAYLKTMRAAQTWADLKGEPAFNLGDYQAITGPLDDFLQEWEQNLPAELLALGQKGTGTVTPPELQPFANLNQALLGFKDQNMVTLRKAAQAMVRCVHDLALDPGDAWRQIWNTGGAGAGADSVSWGNLGALGSFLDSMDAQWGGQLDQLFMPLAEVQHLAQNGLVQAVQDSFDQQWRALLNQYGQEGFAQSFPFQPQAEEEVSREDFTAFAGRLESLAQAYALVGDGGQTAATGQAATAASTGTRLDSQASQVLKRLGGRGRLDFIQQTLAFRDFLQGVGQKAPLSVDLALVPGEIGKHLHWVRLMVGRGQYVDLNVYGKPTVKLPITGTIDQVVLQGLDVNKNPLTALTVSQGDYALWELPLTFGKPLGGQRQKWLIQLSIPSVSEPGRMIAFQMNMDFSAALPVLPRWPGN